MSEPYTSVSTHTGIIYGYGTFTINSATVATWNMFSNTQNIKTGKSNIDSLLICNSYNMKTAICPFTVIPGANTYSLVQVTV